jgi:tetratricopeptide (TPR) repeat protein
MLHKNIRKTLTLLTALFLILTTGCATSIRIAVQKPPNLNTSGIKRIAIMPFEAGFNTYREMAQYATTVATNRIRELNYFTLIDPSEIERLKRNNQNIENYIDAQFIGRITRINVENETRNGSYKTKDGDTVYYTDYITSVEIEFNYSMVLARDNRIIGPVSRKRSSNSSSRESYPSSSDLLRAAIDEQLRYLGRDIAPYTAIETRTFVTEKSKDKILKTEMKDALTQVNAGQYRLALASYLGIYDRYKNIAAAENASILYESLGEIETAAALMRRALNDTESPRAKNVLDRLNKILQDQAILASDYGDTRDQTKKIADFASEEVQKALPKNAKVWIYNKADKDPIAVAIVDNITSGFISQKISVVDRQNFALIEAEQKFNMSGYVSDNDFLSIGNAAGANTIVIIDITGTGSLRRLHVTVLDIEKNVQIMQSDSSEKWQI